MVYFIIILYLSLSENYDLRFVFFMSIIEALYDLSDFQTIIYLKFDIFLLI